MTPPPPRLSEERLREIEREHYARPVEIAQLARELREAREALGKIARQMTAAEYEERHGEELGDVVDTEAYEALVLIARKALEGK